MLTSSCCRDGIGGRCIAVGKDVVGKGLEHGGKDISCSVPAIEDVGILGNHELGMLMTRDVGGATLGFLVIL